jgi:hypothetical protein
VEWFIPFKAQYSNSTIFLPTSTLKVDNIIYEATVQNFFCQISTLLLETYGSIIECYLLYHPIDLTPCCYIYLSNDGCTRAEIWKLLNENIIKTNTILSLHVIIDSHENNLLGYNPEFEKINNNNNIYNNNNNNNNTNDSSILKIDKVNNSNIDELKEKDFLNGALDWSTLPKNVSKKDLQIFFDEFELNKKENKDDEGSFALFGHYYNYEQKQWENKVAIWICFQNPIRRHFLKNKNEKRIESYLDIPVQYF